MNLRKLCLLTFSLVCFSMLFVSCGKSDEEEILDCYTEHINDGIINDYSAAIEAWSLDPTNQQLCEDASEALTTWVTALTEYAKCARDNGVALQAGFENIDEQIQQLESSEDNFGC